MPDYQLVNVNTGTAYGVPPVYMLPERALVANRDLRDSGLAWWTGKVRPVAATASAAELIDALVGLGYKYREAKRLAATVPAGPIEQQLLALFSA